MPRSWLAISLFAALCGCATSAAQSAFDSGDDVGAAKLADDAAEANPRDGAAIALRRRARDHAARRELGETAALRAAGHAETALASLDRLLKQLSDWGGPDVLSADLRGPFDAELAAARAFVATIGARDADAGRPLAAEAELTRQAPFLAHAELAAAAAQAEAHVRDAGASACARLQTTVTSEAPHWGLIVSRYCDHFGVAYQAPPLTSAIAKIDLAGGIVGMTPLQSDELRDYVSQWFTTSLWHEPLGQTTAHAETHGTIASSFRDQSITLHAPYRDKIVTSTSGSGTLSGGTGGFRSVRVSGVSVAKVDRVYEYDAEEHRGTYSMIATISLNVAAGAPLTFTLRRSETVKGVEHDVEFANADVHPVHDRVPTTDEWLRAQLDRLSTRIVLFLNRKFVTLVCTANLQALEPAARCALAGQKPPAALATLGGTLGEDAQRLMPVIAPPPPPKTPRVRIAPQPPARAPRPDVTSDAEDPSTDLSE